MLTNVVDKDGVVHKRSLSEPEIIRAAIKELLLAHDKDYRGHFPDGNPANDIAAKNARLVYTALWETCCMPVLTIEEEFLTK